MTYFCLPQNNLSNIIWDKYQICLKGILESARNVKAFVWAFHRDRMNMWSSKIGNYVYVNFEEFGFISLGITLTSAKF